MKKPIHFAFGLAVLVSIHLATPAVAAVSINYVEVGNPGNPNDTTGYGAVAYNYRIAQNETTIRQYAEFLNAVAKTDSYGLYSTNMDEAHIAGIIRNGSDGSYSYSVSPGSGLRPITYVSWFDAARFCNWLHNGQGSASTETGAYTLNGAMSGIYNVNPGAKIWIPTENEWYKAAYYDPTKDGIGGYWLYPTQSNLLAGNTIGVPNSANYYDGDFGGAPLSVLTSVGAYGANSDSYYHTNDQGGNVFEWNDAVIEWDDGVDSGVSRGLRGGSWVYPGSDMGSLERYASFDSLPLSELDDIGFRVASVSAIPELTSMLSTAVFLTSGLLLRRRTKNPR